MCVDVADKNIKMPSRNVFRSTNEIGIFFNGYSFAVTRVNTNESCAKNSLPCNDPNKSQEKQAQRF